MDTVQRCNLLLQHNKVCVHVLDTRVSCAKSAEPIEIHLGVTHVSPRNHVLDRGHDWMNLFATVRGDKTHYVSIYVASS